MSTLTVGRANRTRALSGVGFGVLVTVGVVVAPLLATGAQPLPDAPAHDTAVYFAANAAAVLVSAACQVLGALALAVFAPATGTGRRATVAGAVAAAALAVSALLSVVLAAVAGSAGEATVDTLRMANFYTGGVVHIVALGVFCWLAALPAVLPAALRWFGRVVAVLAVASIVSLFWYDATLLLPVSRVLGMVWVAVAAVVLAVRSRPGR